MLELFGIMGTAFVIGLSGALMPGPLFAVTVREATRKGAKAGPLLMIGHTILEGALVACLALGFGNFLKSHWALTLISLAGGAGLLWMGGGMIRSARTLTLDLVQSERSGPHPILAGILVSLSNPYWTFWWATVGILYVVSGLNRGIPGVLFFFVGHILSDFAWYTLVSVAVAKGARIMSDRLYRGLVAGCAVLLIGFGAWFILSGVKGAWGG